MSRDEPGETPATEGNEHAFRQLEEWIHATADARNQTPKQVTERLIYADWLFTEFADVVDDVRRQGVQPDETDWSADPPGSSVIDNPGVSVSGSDQEANIADSGAEDSSERSGVDSSRADEGERDRPRMEDIERLCDELQRLTDSTEQNAAELAECVRREEFEELTSRVEREFDGIEAAIEEILRLVDETEARFERELSELGRAVEENEAFIERRKQLTELRRAAIERGVTSAVCEDCGESVPLAMLDTPACPGCAARFDGLAEPGWNPFRSPRLETASEPQGGER